MMLNGKKRKCISSILIFLFVSITTASGQTQTDSGKLYLTLDECLEASLDNSSSIHASLMQTKDARARLSESLTAYLPAVSASLSYSRLSETDPFSITIPTPAGPVTQQLTQSIANSYSLALSLKQPLFTGFRLINNTAKASSAFDASIAEYDRTKNEILYGVKRNYWSLVKSVETLRVIDENLAVVRAFLDDTNNFFKQGIATNNDVLKAKIRLSRAEIAKSDAENNVEIARLQLAVSMGADLAAPVYPKSVEYHDANKTQDESAVLATALGSRPEKKTIEAQIVSSEKDVQLSYSAWYPAVYLVGDLVYAQPNQRYFPPKEEFKLSWDIGFYAGIDTAAWYAALFRTEGADARRLTLLDNARQLDRTITFEVTRALLNRKKAREQVTLSNLVAEQAEENNKIVSENFKSGIAVRTEELEAELQKNQAGLDVIIAKSDYELSIIELDRATGADPLGHSEGR